MKKTAPRNSTIKSLKISDKKVILKSARERRHVYKGKDDSRFYVGNTTRETRMEQTPLKYWKIKRKQSHQPVFYTELKYL